MARAKGNGNGRVNRLEEALAALTQRLDEVAQTHKEMAQRHNELAQAQANLVQVQALMVQNQAAFLAQARENEVRMREMERANAERFARIEAILIEHSRILKALPEAIREKIGFKAPPPQSSA